MVKPKNKGKEPEKGKQPEKISMHAIQKPKIQQTIRWVASDPGPSGSIASTIEHEEMHDAIECVEGNRYCHDIILIVRKYR
jgi:hypothetical protein